MGELLGETLPLALGAAVSPLLLVVQVATLTGPRRLARGAALAAGAAVPLVLVGALMLLLGSAFSLHRSPSAKAALDVALGALLIVVGILSWRRRGAPRGGAGAQGLGRSFLLGAGMMVANFTTLALFLPAVKLIAASDVSDAAKAAVAVVVLVVALAPALVPLALTAVAPGAAARVLEPTGRFLSAHSRTIGAVLALGFGIWLLVKGVTAL